jgi:hypothetical protein
LICTTPSVNLNIGPSKNKLNIGTFNNPFSIQSCKVFFQSGLITLSSNISTSLVSALTAQSSSSLSITGFFILILRWGKF